MYQIPVIIRKKKEKKKKMKEKNLKSIIYTSIRIMDY